jgi:hypothetical protein
MMFIHGPSSYFEVPSDKAVQGAIRRRLLCRLAPALGRGFGDACAILTAVVISETKVEART